MITPVFLGTVDKHAEVILQDDDEFFAQRVSLIGKDIELILRKRRSEKSLEQLGYLFGVVYKKIGEDLGYGKNETHEAIKIELASYQDNNGLVIVESVEKMSMARLAEYIQDVIEWAWYERGLTIPPPKKVTTE